MRGLWRSSRALGTFYFRDFFLLESAGHATDSSLDGQQTPVMGSFAASAYDETRSGRPVSKHIMQKAGLWICFNIDTVPPETSCLVEKINPSIAWPISELDSWSKRPAWHTRFHSDQKRLIFLRSLLVLRCFGSHYSTNSASFTGTITLKQLGDWLKVLRVCSIGGLPCWMSIALEMYLQTCSKGTKPLKMGDQENVVRENIVVPGSV